MVQRIENETPDLKNSVSELSVHERELVG